MKNHRPHSSENQPWRKAHLWLNDAVQRYCRRLEVFSVNHRYLSIILFTLVALLVIPGLFVLSLSVRPQAKTIQTPILAREVLEERFKRSSQRPGNTQEVSPVAVSLTMREQLDIGLRLRAIQQSADPQAALQRWLISHPAVRDSIEAFTYQTQK